MSEMIDTKFQSENLNGLDHLGDLGADGRIILKWILKTYGRRLRTGSR
jgi:hypothetical protein